MKTETKSTALQVVDPHGEILDLADAETERIAELVIDIDDARQRFADVEQIASDELVRRLDRRASWTLRVGDPTVRQFEIKTSSPTAGTTAYDASLLEQELRTLVDRQTIDAEGAALALDRTLTIKVGVPLDADLELIERAVKCAAEIQVAGVTVSVDSVSADRKVKLGGVEKLRKVDGTGAALDRAQLRTPAPKRKAKVAIVQRER